MNAAAADDAFQRIVRQNMRAEMTAQAALAAGSGDPAVFRAVAQLYDNMAQHERALEYADRAVATDGAAQSHFQRAIILQHLGRFAEALTAYRQSAALDPLIARAHLEIVQMSEPEEAAKLAPELTTLFEQVRAHPVRSMFVGHALARIAENAGDAAAAFQWLTRAKAALRKEAPYDHAAAKALHDAAQPIVGTGDSSDEAIFVVGLPRTGTTLLATILGSHPYVQSAGELAQLLLLTNALAGAPEAQPLRAEVLHCATRFDHARLGRGYVESTRPLTGKTQRFVDKAPLNYLLAGVAHAALPNARIICLRRDPMDACLSMYRQVLPVRTGQYNFAYAIEDAAHYVVQFERLLARWRATLSPECFTVLNYEELVGAPEPETRRVVEFCNLEWDARCLEFHKTAGPVATPSATQVRRPIYATSVGRWRQYSALVQPALQILQRADLA